MASPLTLIRFANATLQNGSFQSSPSAQVSVTSEPSPLAQRYHAVFERTPPQALSEIQREKKVFDGANIHTDMQVLAHRDQYDKLIGISFFVGDKLLDLKKLPQPPLTIDATSINGRPLEEFTIAPPAPSLHDALVGFAEKLATEGRCEEASSIQDIARRQKGNCEKID